MTSKDNLNRIPAQRYFTQEELCQVVGISSKEFEAWQRDYGLIGYGGNHYSRLDVLKVVQLKPTFAPYVDAFTHNFIDEAGEPAMDAVVVKQKLHDIVNEIDKVLALSQLAQEV